VISHLSLPAVVDCVASQITFCLLHFVQPINLKAISGQHEQYSSDKSTTSGKKQSQSITHEEKLDAIKRYEHKECMVDTVNAMGIYKSTLRTIRKQGEKIKESCKTATRMTVSDIP
jgi:hypothetical protein